MSATVQCPKCGQEAKSSQSRQINLARTAYSFDCTNSQCRHSFSGVLEMTRGLPSGTTTFSSQPDAITLTDC